MPEKHEDTVAEFRLGAVKARVTIARLVRGVHKTLGSISTRCVS